MANIINNIQNLKAEIEKLKAKTGDSSNLKSNPVNITIVAVTKGIDFPHIQEAINAGITNFGENYVQEAVKKWSPLKAQYPKIKLHLIGNLQSNKIKEALYLFDVIETIDRITLVDKILSSKINISKKQFYIQVNLSNDDKRKGVSFQELPNLLQYCEAKNFKISGLMGIAPLLRDTELAFKKLFTFKKLYNLKELSLGMSNDYAVAIKNGSTAIRIGTKIFGERKTNL